MYEKLVYRQRTLRKLERRPNQAAMVSNDNDLNDNDLTTGFSDNDLIEFFENYIIASCEKNRLIEVLTKSAEQRMRNLRGNKKILASHIHLYVADPDLVNISCSNMNDIICLTFFPISQQINIDFKILYKDHNADSLVSLWPHIGKKPYQLYKIELDRSVDSYHVDDERHDFLTYLQLLPAHKTKFENAVDSMFIFVNVSL